MQARPLSAASQRLLEALDYSHVASRSGALYICADSACCTRPTGTHGAGRAILWAAAVHESLASAEQDAYQLTAAVLEGLASKYTAMPAFSPFRLQAAAAG